MKRYQVRWEEGKKKFDGIEQAIECYNEKRKEGYIVWLDDKEAEKFEGGRMKVISKICSDEGGLCGCGMEVGRKYCLDTNDIDKDGLCGLCFAEMLVEGEFDVLGKQ